MVELGTKLERWYCIAQAFLAIAAASNARGQQLQSALFFGADEISLARVWLMPHRSARPAARASLHVPLGARIKD